MPHTSRKKKKESTKRTQIVDDDGWTRITTSGKKLNPESNVTTVGDTTVNLQHDGVSIIEKVKHYQVTETRWRATESCRILQSHLKNVIQQTSLEVNKCIIFGSGTLCGLVQGWISRQDTAMYQVAVLKSIQITLEDFFGRQIAAFAQEPFYMPADRELLSTLGVEVIDSPAGFDLIDPTVLVYAPGAEQHVKRAIFSRSPGLYLGHKLDREASKSGDKLNSEGQQSAPEDENEGNEWIRFEQRGQYLSIPDATDTKDYPFYHQCLYWIPQPDRDADE